MVKSRKIISVLMAIITLMSAFSFGTTTALAAEKGAAKAYAAVSKSYGKAFPFSKDDKITSKTRVMGVSSKYYSEVYAASKTTGGRKQSQYNIFIAKAKSKKDIKKIKSALENYLENEEDSMSSYLSDTGKKLYKNAKIASKGNYVYLVMIDTDSNKKATKAIKNAL